MKRTQLYIEEGVFLRLQEIGHERMMSVSDLVRKAIRKVYMKENPPDAGEILKKAAGLWKDRTDLGSTEEYVRCLRRDTRASRHQSPK